MIKGCIFDLDGVIVDTAKYHYLAWKKIAEHLDIPFSEEENESLKGISRMASLEHLLNLGKKELNDSQKSKYCQVKNSIYLESVISMDEGEILPGVLDFISELKDLKIQIALGSASKNAKLIMEKIHLLDQFDAIIDGNDVINSKPDPEVFLKGAETLGLMPKDVVVFEDSSKGIDAALTGGFKTVGIGLEKHLGHANLVIEGFQNIGASELFEQLN